jgi:dUTP pyrophosphatase
MLETIKYAKLTSDAKSPTRKNSTDAGIDFYSSETVKIPPHNMRIVHTGITVEIPNGFVLIIKPKSKNNHLIGAGVIDAGYQPGEILVKVINIWDSAMIINKYDPIAQGVYLPIETPSLIETNVEDLRHDSSRSGQGGITTQAKEK